MQFFQDGHACRKKVFRGTRKILCAALASDGQEVFVMHGCI